MANYNPTDTKEIWKPVIGYKGVYEVSNLGRIKRIGAVPGATPGQILTPSKYGKYLIVTLHKDGQKAYATVHSVVAKAFIGPRPSGHQINHKNAVKTDNRVDNLEYMTPKQNREHAKQMGLFRGPDRQWAAKLTPNDVRQIRKLLAKGIRQKDIAQMFGIVQSGVHLIKVGRRHKNIL